MQELKNKKLWKIILMRKPSSQETSQKQNREFTNVFTPKRKYFPIVGVRTDFQLITN